MGTERAKPNELRDALLAEARALAARIEAQAAQAERFRQLADRIDERTAADRALLEDIEGQLGIAIQLRTDDMNQRLGGQRLERIAIELLQQTRSGVNEIHYREWFQLLQDAGVRVRGRNPLATFLAQINRSEQVESLGQRSGRYRLRAA
jgi:hypothetical protein